LIKYHSFTGLGIGNLSQNSMRRTRVSGSKAHWRKAG
jgi:hypothetical protein